LQISPLFNKFPDTIFEQCPGVYRAIPVACPAKMIYENPELWLLGFGHSENV